MASPPAPTIVDVHTHMYPQEYIDLLTARTTIPLIRTFPSAPTSPRLILLDSELPLPADPPASHLPGRPLSQAYTSLPTKLLFMSRHSITTSILSLANPWLDFLPPTTAPAIAATINTSFSTSCAAHPSKLYFFAALPLTAPVPAILDSITHAASLPYSRGVILGTSGLGSGLDDPGLLPILHAIADAGLVVFLHPHYGLPSSVFGPRADEYGHVLPLALGFPLETTVAVTRMFLAGVFDAVPGLRVLLAHGGGAAGVLAGRVDSCVAHDGLLVGEGRVEGRRTFGQVLREQVYLDAVVYGGAAVRTAVEVVGGERVMFGTDHPFFPPVGKVEDGEGVWESVGSNVTGVRDGFGEDEEGVRAVMGGNAIKIFRLEGE